MGSLDPAKILVVFVIALIVLGPERLPKVARQAGAAWRELTRVREEVMEEVRSALPDTADLPSIPRIPSVRGTLTRYISEPSAAGATGSSQAVGDARAGAHSENGDGTDQALISAGNADPSFGAVPEFVPLADDPSMN